MSASATIIDASDATPIVIESQYPHGFTTNDQVRVSGVSGNDAANGTWPIIVVDPSHFSLTGSAGSGSFIPSAIARAVDLTMAPAEPVAQGFGRDLYGIEDLDPGLIEVDGSGGDPLIVGQALCRRLMTPRGGLVGDPNYGFDLTALIGDDFTIGQIARFAASINAECQKDQRVQACASTLTYDPNTSILTVVLSVTTAAGPFTFTLQASSVTVKLLGVSL